MLIVSSPDTSWPSAQQFSDSLRRRWPDCAVVTFPERDEVEFQIPVLPGFSVIFAPRVITSDGTESQNAEVGLLVAEEFSGDGRWWILDEDASRGRILTPGLSVDTLLADWEPFDPTILWDHVDTNVVLDPMTAMGGLSLFAEGWGKVDLPQFSIEAWRFFQEFSADLGGITWQVTGFGPITSAADLVRAGGEPRYPEGVGQGVSRAIHPDDGKTWSVWPATMIEGRTLAVRTSWERYGLATRVSLIVSIQGEEDSQSWTLQTAALRLAVHLLPVSTAELSTPEFRQQARDPDGPHDLPAIGIKNWIKGRTPDDLTGSGATNVQPLSGGVLFDLTPDTVARAREFLTGTGVVKPLSPSRPEFLDSLPEPDPAFREYITGVVPQPDGSIPTYVVDHPRAEPVRFHGHVWRNTPTGPVEVYLTSLGGYGPLLRTDPRARLALQNTWAFQASRQHDVVPTTSRNEWHVDDQATYDALIEALEPQHSDAIVYLHPRP
ncbi:hypothetical protein [Branchiibius sp. NY16-3462-2]|uniref:hypothetical protein n=1 Tax=Branchiibius sp. NY16-3462-2 TaxID=1807500 RepID=UPI0025BA9FB7|nr:hypothetical protein [Branchiibius sp. NY16-3462-2]